MDERTLDRVNPLTGRSALREWQEQLQLQQMRLVAEQCAAHQTEEPVTVYVVVCRTATHYPVYGAYATETAATEAVHKAKADIDEHRRSGEQVLVGDHHIFTIEPHEVQQ